MKMKPLFNMELSDISSDFFLRNDKYESLLSKYAVKSKNSRRKQKESQTNFYRNPFQVDRDRIIHTNSFRRLKHKSQVFVAPQGDHYTTRLTHVIEVSQIGRTIARALNLNEDLVEAASLGHDLGHTPFGHIGESVLDKILDQGFHHSRHSVKIIEMIEKNGKGLNLTDSVIEAIKRHSKVQGEFLTEESILGMSLEAQIVRISDALAYLSHDIEDAKRSGFIDLKQIPENIDIFFNIPRSERINIFVSDVVINSWNCTGNNQIKKAPFIKMSNNLSKSLTILRNYMFENFYLPVSDSKQGKAASKIIEVLFDYYLSNFEKIPNKKYLLNQDKNITVADFICGMTDLYAIKESEEIFSGISKDLKFKNI